MNQRAPEGAIYVCTACGKQSRDLYGNEKVSRGWDASCMLHAVLVIEASIVLDGGRVTKADLFKEPAGTSPASV